MRKEILEITRSQQYTDSNLVSVQIGVQPKSKGKSKHGKDAKITSSEKVKDHDQRKCYYCREAGHPEQDETEGPDRCRVETSDCKLPTK